MPLSWRNLGKGNTKKLIFVNDKNDRKSLLPDEKSLLMTNWTGLLPLIEVWPYAITGVNLSKILYLQQAKMQLIRLSIVCIV